MRAWGQLYALISDWSILSWTLNLNDTALNFLGEARFNRRLLFRLSMEPWKFVLYFACTQKERLSYMSRSEKTQLKVFRIVYVGCNNPAKRCKCRHVVSTL